MRTDTTLHRRASHLAAASRAPRIAVPAVGAARAAWLLPALALAGCAAGVLLALALAAFSPPVAREPALENLLRGMTVLKALMVSAGLGLFAWRAQHGLSARAAAAYLLPLWLAAGAVGLLAMLAFVGPAAAAFHVGELAFLVAAWRDGRAARA